MTSEKVRRLPTDCNTLSRDATQRGSVRARKTTRSHWRKSRNAEGGALSVDKGSRVTSCSNSSQIRSLDSNSKYRDSIFDEVTTYDAGSFKKKALREWNLQLEALATANLSWSRKAWEKMEKRRNRYSMCGENLFVRSCTDCDFLRSGSGSFVGTKTCKTRACPFCWGSRQGNINEFFDRAFDLLESPESAEESYVWQFFVVSTKYDSTAEEAVTVEALRERAELLQRVNSHLWNYFKISGAGMFTSIELGSKGHVHSNVLFFGPPLYAREVEREARSVDPSVVGNVHLQDVDSSTDPENPGQRIKSKDRRGSKDGLKKVAKYITKGVAGARESSREEWISGNRGAKTIDPALAVRWEFATSGGPKTIRLSQKYGALRGLKFDEHGENADYDKTGKADPKDDSNVACECCGVVGKWQDRLVRAKAWVQLCHFERGGAKAMRSGFWTPMEDDPPY